MKMTLKSEYALLALVHLARHKDDGFLSVDSIARAQDIPPKFLEQIFLILKRGRYLKSAKGQKGGYMLAREPREINVAEIIRLTDGPLAPTDSVSKYFYGATPIEKEQKLVDIFREIRNYVSDKLEGTTLDAMC